MNAIEAQVLEGFEKSGWEMLLFVPSKRKAGVDPGAWTVYRDPPLADDLAILLGRTRPMPPGFRLALMGSSAVRPIPLREYLLGLIGEVFRQVDLFVTNLRGDTWLRLVRLVAERIVHAEPEVALADPRITDMLTIRRQMLTGLAIPGMLAEQMKEGQAFAYTRKPAMLLRFGDLHRIAGPLGKDALVDSRPLAHPWPEPLIREVCRQLRPHIDLGAMAADEDFGVRIGRAPVIGTGQYRGIRVTKDLCGNLEVSLDVETPFLQEAIPGSFILWEDPIQVYLRDLPDSRVTSISAFPVFARQFVPPWRVGTLRSPLASHCFVSTGSQTCLGPTYDAICAARPDADAVNRLIEGRLRTASRVLRYGWQQVHPHMVHHDYRGLIEWTEDGTLDSGPFVVLSEAEATAYVREHPQACIARFE